MRYFNSICLVSACLLMGATFGDMPSGLEPPFSFKITSETIPSPATPGPVTLILNITPDIACDIITVDITDIDHMACDGPQSIVAPAATGEVTTVEFNIEICSDDTCGLKFQIIGGEYSQRFAAYWVTTGDTVRSYPGNPRLSLIHRYRPDSITVPIRHTPRPGDTFPHGHGIRRRIHPSGDTTVRVHVTRHLAHDYHVKWSPDGNYLAFASQRSGEPKIWIVPASGGEPALLETGLSGDHHLGWSPDGSEIVFDALGPEGRPNIWIVSIGDGKVRSLLDDRGPNFQPAWSPDGSAIAYASFRSGNPDIWVAPASGGNPVRLTFDDAIDHHPQWSPDGRYIAFTSFRGGSADIWIIPSGGGTPRQITTHPGEDDQACFSPDGSLIAFMSDRGGKRDIWIVPVGGGEARKITEQGENAWPSWSPDGEWIAYSSNQNDNSDIWVIEVKLR